LARQGQTHWGTDLSLAVYATRVERMKGEEYQAEAWFSLWTPQGVENHQYPLGGEYPILRERASVIALDMVRKYLLKIEGVSP